MTTAVAQGPVRVPTPRQKQQSSSASTPNPNLGPLDVSVSDKPVTGSTAKAQSPSPTTTPSGPAAGGASASNGSGNANVNGDGNGNGAGRRGARNGASSDPLSDRATAMLIRRILCPQQMDKGKSTSASIEGLLPPLTSRNDVDLQLYALISIILREYVQNWYSKITPDETFVAEIVQIIAHCTRALEQRIRKVDLESLLLDEIPDLLDRHITAYRAAHNPITQPPIETNPREIYHSLCPLPALSPIPRPGFPESSTEQAENEGAYRQLLVHGVLAILLPTEDLENECLTALVGQIFSELIIGNNVANKLSEPWLILEMLLVVTRVIQRRKLAGDGENGALGTTGSTDKAHVQVPRAVGGRKSFSVQSLLWSIVHWCFLAISFVRVIFTILIVSRSLPRRASLGLHDHDDGASRDKSGLEPMQSAEVSKMAAEPVKTPVLAFRCWPAISNLIEMDVRMPWLCGTFSMVQWITTVRPGRMAGVDGVIDRLLSHGIHRYLLDPAGIPPLLRNVRGALFPNNMPGTSTLTPPSSELKLRALRRRCARALWANLVPSRMVGRLYFGGTEGAAASSHRRARPGQSSNGTSGASINTGSQISAVKRSAAQQGSTSDEAATASSSPRTAPRNGGGGGSGQKKPLGNYNKNKDDNGEGGSGSRSKKQQQGQSQISATSASTDETETGADDEEIIRDIEEGILDIFSDAYCNKHFVYSVLELVLVRIMPELAEKGVTELWGERVGS